MTQISRFALPLSLATWRSHRRAATRLPPSVLAAVGILACAGCATETVPTTPVEFSNPIAPLQIAEAPALAEAGLDSADPFIFTWNGRYWLTHTAGHRVVLRSADTLGGLASAPLVDVWHPGEGGAPPAYVSDVWAPEFHRLEGPNGFRFYLYVAADPSDLSAQRLLVLESAADDPLGPFTFKGMLDTGGFAIDATVTTVGGRNYVLYSGHTTAGFTPASIFLAELSDPWTLAAPPIVISSPSFAWEQEGLAINEGPEVLLHGPWLHVIFSADACTGPTYKLGRLTVPASANLLDPATWASAKASEPVFVTSEADGVFGPGHGSFFRSPDGTEDWQIYHATTEPGFTCLLGLPRLARAQRIEWNADGTPEFGHPTSLATRIAPPSGDATLSRQFEDDRSARATGGTLEFVDGDEYVGRRAVGLTNAEVGTRMSFHVAIPEDGTYRLRVRMRVGADGGIVRLDVNGTDAPTAIVDTYRDRSDVTELDFGTRMLPRGTSTFRFTVTGKSDTSVGFGVTVDEVRLR